MSELTLTSLEIDSNFLNLFPQSPAVSCSLLQSPAVSYSLMRINIFKLFNSHNQGWHPRGRGYPRAEQFENYGRAGMRNFETYSMLEFDAIYYFRMVNKCKKRSPI